MLSSAATVSPIRLIRGHLPRLSGLSLQPKLILSFSALLMAALAVGSWFSVDRSQETLSDILGEQARQIAQTLALAAETPYESNELSELERLSRDLLKSRNIVLIVFYDKQGKPLSLACRDGDFNLNRYEDSPEFQDNLKQLMLVQRRTTAALGQFLQVTVPVFDSIQSARAEAGGVDQPSLRLLGYLTVGISQNVEQAQLQRVGVMGLGLGCLLFLVSLPLISGLVHRILLPIRQLVAATNRLSAGDFDAHVATDRPDEIGMLARSFNQMVLKVREHQQALEVANDQLADANRHLEEKVRARTAELETSNHRLSSEIAEKEDFLRAVSHDLNAPLRNISGMATMLLMKCREKFDDDVIHRLERIRKNVDVETDLISELLELSRIKTRRQKMEPVDVDEMVRDLAGMFENDLRQRNITLAVETQLPMLHCERARVRQVFQNLIDNAIKYIGGGAVREIHVGHAIEGGGVRFWVRDSGIGIEKDDLTKVFYVFRRGKNSAEMNVPGKGVGLASVKSIVETYGGRIWVESEVGVGTTFHFTVDRKFVPSLCSPAGQPERELAGAV